MLPRQPGQLFLLAAERGDVVIGQLAPLTRESPAQAVPRFLQNVLIPATAGHRFQNRDPPLLVRLYQGWVWNGDHEQQSCHDEPDAQHEPSQVFCPIHSFRLLS